MEWRDSDVAGHCRRDPYGWYGCRLKRPDLRAYPGGVAERKSAIGRCRPGFRSRLGHHHRHPRYDHCFGVHPVSLWVWPCQRICCNAYVRPFCQPVYRSVCLTSNFRRHSRPQAARRGLKYLIVFKEASKVEFFRNTKIDFLGWKWYFLGFSLIFSVAGLLSMFFWHGIPLGVDFKGGAQVRVKFAQPPDDNQIRAAMDRAGLHNARIQRFGSAANNEELISLEQKEISGASLDHG